jgi:hypothetical protein
MERMAALGRSRRPGVARFPSGKIKPTDRLREPPATDTAKAQRLKAGATLENWQDQRHCTVFGRIYRDGALSKHPETAAQLYEAGLWYAGLWRSMRAAIECRQPHTGTPQAPSGRSVEESDTLKAIARHRAAERNLTRFEQMAVWEVLMVERDAPAERWVPYLRTGLHKLATFREGRKAA